MSELLWKPSPERVAQAAMTRFMERVRQGHGVPLDGYEDLHCWSVEHPEAFWREVWGFCGVQGEPGGTVLENGHLMPAARWFPDTRLNYAENLLRRGDDSPALIFRSEELETRREVSFARLRREVAKAAAALRAAGVEPGDRVAGCMPNIPETVTAMLAATSIGAIWSSCSPDFGVSGVLDRFGQIEPKVLVCADGYFYNCKLRDSLDRAQEVARALPSLKKVVVCTYARSGFDLPQVPGATSWEDFLDPHEGAGLRFRRVPFDHPLFIMYSSGTTGHPKCIVHGHGGTLLQHLKEHRLHCDIRRDDRVFYFTTCGWMMWNWLVSALASEATVMLFDGSPFRRRLSVLFDYAEGEGMTLFGTSAKYIDAAKKSGLCPAETHDLSALRTITSTGSPLVPESFDYVYEKVKRDVCLSSISGGTDILSCFVLGNPTDGVRRGEIQCRGLGMKVEVYDDRGRPVVGRQGELVCTAPFPSMPTGFWNDPEGTRFRRAYFQRFPGVWCHGDWVELTERGSMIIYGRSDAVLNPGGVRIGTAEIYRQVEQLDEVVESLAVGQRQNGDERVVLFVRLAEGHHLDRELCERIRRRIRENTTPRHVPARILEVPDIPRTKSGKITEVAVREVIHGREVTNREALANPEALEAFSGRPELAL